MKIAVVYWSGTGNTETMAHAVVDGAKAKGAEVDLIQAASFGADDVAKYDAIAFGCPAMGDETLEEDEFEPMFASVEGSLQGKKIGLFGSWGWGAGAYMDAWKERCGKDGAVLVADPVLCENTPDDDAIKNCENLGGTLAG